ncbi:MAG: adenosylmethionine decarboxylase [Actinomycetota bacterium]|nr:adenosylmethionine decarboxylase [Actinomycetota bacterium]MDI6822716.1 adenosylmethionine decarboxylase [Actinomycetota bacterium]
MKTKNVGRHLVIEFWDCKNLNSAELAEKALQEAVRACGATLLELKVHQFSPHGITGVAMIAESHILIHTWPELGYAAVDVFTCGEQVDPVAAIDPFQKHFSPKHVQMVEIRRGVLRD